MKKWLRTIIGGVLFVSSVGIVHGNETLDKINLLGEQLLQCQVKTGKCVGTWPEEEWATGSISLGITSAYEQTGDEKYIFPNLQSCLYMHNTSQTIDEGEVYFAYSGDGAYSIVRWYKMYPSAWILSPLQEFYQLLAVHNVGNYIAGYADYDPSMAVYYVAHHLLATHSLRLDQAGSWRQGLIAMLGAVNDESDFPIQALAVSLWGLAKTGPLDDTFIDFGAPPDSIWYQRQLKDLPGMLLEHQVPDGENYTGSFYWQFDHQGGPNNDIVSSGYTEDSVYAALALTAIADRFVLETPTQYPILEDLKEPLMLLERVLVDSVRDDGTVCSHISIGDQAMYAFAGEVLHALCALNKYHQGQTQLID